jgi:hypothetical protein
MNRRFIACSTQLSSEGLTHKFFKMQSDHGYSSEIDMEIEGDEVDTIYDSTKRLYEQTCLEDKSVKTRYAYGLRIKKLQEKLAEQHHLPKGTEVDLLKASAEEVISIITRESNVYGENNSIISEKSSSVPESFRSALVWYFRNKNLDLPSSYASLQRFIQGRRRKVRTRRAETNTNQQTDLEGKEVLEFSDFCALSEESLLEDIKVHLFIVLTWNLSCRGETTIHLTYDNIRWCNDCLLIEIAKSKTHQYGAEKGEHCAHSAFVYLSNNCVMYVGYHHQVHTYANPLNPKICVFTALGLHVLLNTALLMPDVRMFSGKNEHDRCSTKLRNVLNKVDPDGHKSLGTQSFRKGVLSWLMSHPGAASNTAGLLRGEWSIGGLLPRYVRQMAHGDCAAGRVAAGLPTAEVGFCILPPRFRKGSRCDIGAYILDYLSYPVGFRACIPYLLASVVHHRHFLLETLPAAHPIFATRLWRDRETVAANILPPTLMNCPLTDMTASGTEACTNLLYNIHRGVPLPMASGSGGQHASAGPADSVGAASAGSGDVQAAVGHCAVHAAGAAGAAGAGHVSSAQSGAVQAAVGRFVADAAGAAGAGDLASAQSGTVQASVVQAAVGRFAADAAGAAGASRAIAGSGAVQAAVGRFAAHAADAADAASSPREEFLNAVSATVSRTFASCMREYGLLPAVGQTSVGSASETGLQPRQLLTNFKWPADLRVVPLHQLWHFGESDDDPNKCRPPYKRIGKLEVVEGGKWMSHAKGVMEAIDAHMKPSVAAFLSMTVPERTMALKDAMIALAKELEARSLLENPAAAVSADNYLYRLNHSQYRSIYANDLRLLRKTKGVDDNK